MATVMMLAPVMAMTEAAPPGSENDKGGDDNANGELRANFGNSISHSIRSAWISNQQQAYHAHV